MGGAAGGALVARNHLLADAEKPMPLRPLGRTGFKVSVVGFSGFALKSDDQETCTAAVRQALRRGVNYLDVAPAYGKGTCEERMGIALEGVPRGSYYLACKTKKRDAAGAREELERSLQRLKTDFFDVYQLHHLSRPEDVKTVLGAGGAMEVIIKAKQEGKIRAIGFSAHTSRAALDALNGFAFDTVMFPINHVEWYTNDFGPAVVELANKKGAGILSIKPMSMGRWPKGQPRARKWWYRSFEEQDDINLAFRWVLGRPGVATGFPPAWLDLQERAITAGKAYRPATEEDTAKMRELAKGNAGTLFKREEDLVSMGRMPWSPYPERPWVRA